MFAERRGEQKTTLTLIQLQTRPGVRGSKPRISSPDETEAEGFNAHR